jgi:hypothetical protein
MAQAHRVNEIDKSTWGDGPWMTEPDRVEWRHAGLPCLALRNQMGVWCGYAAVPPGHPWHGVHYSACAEGCPPDPVLPLEERYPISEDMTPAEREFCARLRALDARAEAIGGIFSPTQWRREHPSYGCDDHSPESRIEVHGGLTYSDFCHGDICHVPEPGEPDDVFWFGCDFGHAFDYCPGMRAHLTPSERTPYDHARACGGRADVYRTLDYVRGEVNRLAEQLAAVRTA